MSDQENTYPKKEDVARYHIEVGCKDPYDDRPPVDEANMTALGVLHRLYDTPPLAGGMREMEMESREQVVDDVSAIIRYGSAMPVEFIKTFVIDDSEAEEPPVPE